MFEIQTLFYPDHWENCFHINDKLLTFATLKEAEAELQDHLDNLAHNASINLAVCDFENYRIAEVQSCE
jgi:hypothetical protein